ncbi:hypothetical protein [Celeribacter sp.]|uniref:hypothetical protein n=1 Tax=Celeribacter sp. TaxID=1890673 RepID=UPI003A8D9250
MNRSHHFLKLTASTALAVFVGFPSFAQGTGDYSDETNWDINRTTERALGMNAGGMVGDMAMPGYNPNALRPAGDGFGRHQATQDVEMQGNNLTGVNEITGVSRIVGNGILVIENLDYPINGFDAANKAYVDEEIAKAAEDLEDSVGETQEGLDNLTGGDGIDRNGDSFEVDNSVVRTFGDQNIGGVKNFQTRINVSSTSNRPLDSRSHAEDGVGLYGRASSIYGGYGVVGMNEGASGAGVLAETLSVNGLPLMVSAPSTAMSLVGLSAGGNIVSEISSVGDGVAITGIELPTRGDHAASKEYVDLVVDMLRDEFGITAVAPYIRESVTVTWNGADTPIEDYYYYSCATRTLNPDGSRTCSDMVIKTPVRPVRAAFRLAETNVQTIVNLGISLTGSCALGDQIGYDDVHYFYGTSFPAETTDAEVYFDAHYPESWGFVEGAPDHGPGTVTDGCNFQPRAQIFTPSDPEFERLKSFTLYDQNVTPMTSGYTVEEP